MSTPSSSTLLSPLSICLFYMLTAISLLLFNKLAFSAYSFDCSNILTLTQSLFSLFLVSIFSRFGFISVQPFSASNFRRFLPIGFSFFLYMMLGMIALRLVSLPIYTTLRRTGVIFVLVLERFYQGQSTSKQVLLCVILQVFGALIAGLTDFNFDFTSYAIVFAYNFITAIYLVLINSIAAEEKRKARGLNQFDFLYLNSLLLVFPLLLIIFYSGEFSLFIAIPHWGDPLFLLTLFASSTLAFFLNYFIFLNASVNSALTQTVAGQAKDFLVVVFGFLFPDAKFQMMNFIGILLGFAGAIAYAMVKGNEKQGNQSHNLSTKNSRQEDREALMDFEAGQYRNNKET
jgi:solute carrier family 35 protein